MKRLELTILGLSLALSACAFAEQPGGERGGRPQGPPPESIEACAAASEGDSCSFSGRRGEELQGVCKSLRDEQLACVPDNAPEPPSGRGM